MHMPLMVNLRRVVVFGGERGEGLQKSEKLALYADAVLIVPESRPAAPYIEFPAGPVRFVAEKLAFKQTVQVPLAKQAATRWNIGRHLRGADFVCSDLADRKLNEQISRLCARRGIRCNIIDTKDLGDTWFMSLIDVPGLLTGISSRGECAYAARAAREDLHETLEHQGRISQILSRARAAYLATPGAKPAKGALRMLENLNRHPDFRRLCTHNGWDQAAAFAEKFAIEFDGANT